MMWAHAFIEDVGTRGGSVLMGFEDTKSVEGGQWEELQ